MVEFPHSMAPEDSLAVPVQRANCRPEGNWGAASRRTLPSSQTNSSEPAALSRSAAASVPDIESLKFAFIEPVPQLSCVSALTAVRDACWMLPSPA